MNLCGTDAWNRQWFEGTISPRRMDVWRGVEAQHVVSTMRLVDTLDEQALLESLLETSKPALPVTAQRKHYLLTTPFRYRPAHPSRFRPAGATGQWYGAQTLYAACAEVAYWRHRFIIDSDGLRDGVLLTEHSFFKAHIEGNSIDLMAAPWREARALWMRDLDYRHTHAVAAAAQAHQVQWLSYESVRAPGECCAVAFKPDCLFEPEPSLEHTLQRWACKTTRTSVMLMGHGQRFMWNFSAPPQTP